MKDYCKHIVTFKSQNSYLLLKKGLAFYNVTVMKDEYINTTLNTRIGYDYSS